MADSPQDTSSVHRDNRGSLLSAFARVIAGVLAGQLLFVLALPVISRVLAPDELGYFGRSLAMAMVVSVILTFRLETAILSSPLRSRQRWITTTAVLLSALLAGLAVTVSLVIPNGAATLLGVGNGVDLAIIVVAGFSLSIFNTLNNSAAGSGSYRLIGRSKPIKQAVEVLSLIIFGVSEAPTWLLPFSTVLGCAAGTGVLVLGSQLLGVNRNPCRLILRVRAIAIRYRRFSFYDLPASLMVHLRLALPLLLLGQRFSLATVGLFALMQRVLDAPASLASSSVGVVFRGELGRHPRPRQLFLQVATPLVAVALVMASCLFLLPDGFYPAVLGAMWVDAGPMAVALAPYAALRLIALPLGYAYYVEEAVGLHLILQGIALALAVAVFALGPRSWSAVDLAAAYGITQAAYYALFVVWAFLLTGKRSRSRQLDSTSGAKD